MAIGRAIVTLTGISPMLMHRASGFLNPLDPDRKQMAELTSKRTKTEADYASISRIEMKLGLYVKDGRPFIPGEVVDAVLIEGAKKSKCGPKAKAGVFCGDGVLDYTGPKDPAKIVDDPDMRDVRSVVLQRNRVLRTRPIFRDWSVSVEINFDDAVVNASDIEKWLADAGRLCGIGDYRPKFGRFVVETFDIQKEAA